MGTEFRYGTWVFSVPKATCARSTAWVRCCRAGKKMGIWHAYWLKAHTATHWRYYTTTDTHVRLRWEAEKRRKEQPHG